MQELQVDFCRTRRAPRWIAPLLLAIAIVFTGDAIFAFLSVRTDISKNEKALARLDPKLYKAPRRASAEELALARDTLQRLTTPWERLFAALEGAASDRVALLAIEPDPHAGKVTITGDSKDYLAALSYVLDLSRAEGLSQVQLVRHEIRTGDPQQPVSFSVSAAWSMAK